MEWHQIGTYLAQHACYQFEPVPKKVPKSPLWKWCFGPTLSISRSKAWSHKTPKAIIGERLGVAPFPAFQRASGWHDIFSFGNPSFATVAGWGVDPRYRLPIGFQASHRFHQTQKTGGFQMCFVEKKILKISKKNHLLLGIGKKESQSIPTFTPSTCQRSPWTRPLGSQTFSCTTGGHILSRWCSAILSCSCCNKYLGVFRYQIIFSWISGGNFNGGFSKPKKTNEGDWSGWIG